MTAGTPAIGVSGAPAYATGEYQWIPAFAGMTLVAATMALSMASLPQRHKNP